MPIPRPEMNTTPLIDVLPVLLVLLILTIPMATHKVAMELPQGGSTANHLLPIRIEIDFDGMVFWDGESVGQDDHLELMFRALAANPQAAPVLVIADRRARYERVVQVLAAAQRAHVDRVALQPVSD